MKILHLSAVRDWGGGEKHIENLCLEMAENFPGVDNIVLCRKGSLFEQSLKKHSLKHYTSPVFTNFDIRYALKITSICRKEKIDLIHIHDPKALALAVALDRFKDLPPFVFSKKTSFPIKNRKSSLYKYNYYKISSILCVTKESCKVISRSITDSSKLKQIYHGFRPQREKQKLQREVIRKKLNIPEGKKIIGNIANHTWPKNLQTYLEMAHRLIYEDKREDLCFVQIGNFDRETPGLQNKLKELKLEEHFKFYGFMPDASSFLPGLDVLVISSQSEGLPNVLYEAAFHKIPIVSTNVGGIPELVRHMETGLLSEVFKPEDLADNAVFLLENKEKAKQFTDAAYHNLLKNFTSKRMAELTFAEYKKVIYGKV